jgi:hypothetical protein
MKRKLFAVVAFALVFGLLLVPSVGFAAYQVASDDSVTEAEAEEAALQYIASFSQLIPEWDGAKVSIPVTYYTPDDNKSAYEFIVLNNNKEVGFIIISARADWMPVLEFGGGKAPSSYLVWTNKIALEKGYATEGQNTRLLYWGGLTYSVQYGQEMKAEGIALHLPTGRIEKVPEGEVDLQMDEDQARLEWDRLLASANGVGIAPLSVEYHYISGVPAYHQSSSDAGYGDDGDDAGASWPSCSGTDDDPWDAWDGCSPIAGAMIHGYWDSHGYSSLPNGEDTLIDDNHHYMDTSDEGSTSTSNRDDGIIDVFEAAGYDDDFWVHNDYYVTWGDITTQMDSDFPAVLGIHGGSSPYSGGHSVTIIGYLKNGDTQLIRLYDTWDTAPHWLTHGNWSTANMTKVEEE